MDNYLVTLLTDPLLLGLLVVLIVVCASDISRRKREVEEYNQDQAAYLELQRQGRRR